MRLSRSPNWITAIGETFPGEGDVAVIWTFKQRHGGKESLSPPGRLLPHLHGFPFADVSGINNSGWIVGTGSNLSFTKNVPLIWMGRQTLRKKEVGRIADPRLHISLRGQLHWLL